MRRFRPIVLNFAALGGCARDMDGKWPSLAPRAGEVTAQVTGPCAGCGQDIAVAPAEPLPAPAPLPADTASRLTAIAGVIAGIEAKVPTQARTATEAIAAARRDSARGGDAEVERSRYEALFLPLSVEERRLDLLADDVAGRDGGDAALATVETLRGRLMVLQAKRGALPN